MAMRSLASASPVRVIVSAIERRDGEVEADFAR